MNVPFCCSATFTPSASVQSELAHTKSLHKHGVLIENLASRVANHESITSSNCHAVMRLQRPGDGPVCVALKPDMFLVLFGICYYL